MMHPYATEAYARSLSHWGQALHVPEWGCHVIVRDTPGGSDAAGTYPLAIMACDADLAGGLDRLRKLGMISVTLVLDDFHRPQLAELKRYFSVVNPFKSHHVLRNPSIFAYGKHHRYEVRRALAKVSVRLFDLSHHLSEWSSLYADLTGRHGFSGVHDFPSSHFDALCLLDGTQAIGAWLEDRLVSAHIWMSDGKYVHSHLAASSSDGYASRAAYAVNDASIRHFQGADLLNFGGAAGAGDDPCDGLARFKRGFANDVAPAFICGAVLDRPRYDELARRTAAPPDTLFFPAYRTGTG